MTAFDNNCGLETSIMNRIHTKLLAYYGHITRMVNSRLPLITVDGSTEGTRPRGRPSKRWTDISNESCPARGHTSLNKARRLRIGLVGGLSFVAAILTERSLGQERLKSSHPVYVTQVAEILFPYPKLTGLHLSMPHP